MKITKHIDGWNITPSTDTEEGALEYLIHALKNTYETTQEVSSLTANHSHQMCADHTRETPLSK